ncbi:MAG TPA: RrF2 family transcriptional regulator [Deltaproteobacteria bacterium]|nr:RrF2 family transcriptional regulator [Deltaproteobacteria bacterium]
MKLSTRGRYSVRIMLDLAIHDDAGPVFLKDIALRQQISQKYLWQLINPLKTTGLIKSVRGSNGGYSLARTASQITLKDIIQVGEGSLSLVDCVDDAGECGRSELCVYRDVWMEATKKMLETFEALSLEDMVKRHWQKFSGISEK